MTLIDPRKLPPLTADWYGMGREAFIAGLALDMCPRSEGDAASRSWVEGWHAAEGGNLNLGEEGP
ncbi:TPA: hypothetical protein VDU31_005909 [Pseudomonas aeruginosa]|nr:hypothetical protein [Pseudomonas aeruginosa]